MNPPSQPEYSYRYHPVKERWERTIIGKSKWEVDPERTKAIKWDDDSFINAWASTTLQNGSIRTVAMEFNTTYQRVRNKRNSVNRRYRKELGLDDSHNVLPELPKWTPDEQRRVDSHFTPKPKVLTLAEKLRTLPKAYRVVLDLGGKVEAK
tara:strand:+ start:209 stop:661 length:453 start_codon:yes stop_codon:yes gene_type:complete